MSCDASEAVKLLTDLSDKDALKAVRGGLRKQLSKVRAGVRREFKNRHPKHRANHKTWTQMGYYYARPLWHDIKLRLNKESLGGLVSLFNPKRKPNRAYVLRFLNSGSEGNRTTKKGHNTGYLKADNFFEAGVNATMDEAAAGLEKAILAQIDKIVNGGK